MSATCSRWSPPRRAHAAREAAALVEVEYEVLEPVTDPFDALARRRAAAAPDGGQRAVASRTSSAATSTPRSPPPRTSSPRRSGRSSSSTRSSSRSRRSPFRTANGDGRASHVYSQGQGIWEDRHQIASFLGAAADAVRVTQVSTGGAFGAKEDLNVQGHAALLALTTGRPVLLTLSRKESLRFHSKRHPLTMEYTVGCDADGHLLGGARADRRRHGRVRERRRQGARARGRPRVQRVRDPERRHRGQRRLHEQPAMRRDARVRRRTRRTSRMEGVLDMLAERVGIDGWEIRWRNAAGRRASASAPASCSARASA